MKRLAALLLLLSWLPDLSAQEIVRDTLLREVVVQAFASDRVIENVPASIGIVAQSDFQRFTGATILPAFNVIPGVRMEERSPGSYRFSIRGSSIRSPFGVRNVKVYWNGLPFTDAGGNTYLNLIDADNIGSVEILKGPAGSVYGAGTGGVLLFESPLITKDRLAFSAMYGSYGLQRYGVDASVKTEKLNATANVVHQQADNYRVQSAMRRTSVSTRILFPVKTRNFFTSNILYTSLSYETPGGLTKAQFDEDPSQARPSTAVIPGAEVQKAEVNNETFLAGITHEYQWNVTTTTTTGIYASLIDFKNPSIRNFEVRNEKNYGMRSVTKNTKTGNNISNSLSGGFEFQHMTSPIDVYENNGGVKGDPITQDELTADLFFVFLQDELEIKRNFIVTAGLSLNLSSVDFLRTYPGTVNASRQFDPVLLPRLAVLYKIFKTMSLYGSLSRGFSQPTIAELYPSRNIFDNNLEAEHGNNLEVGIKKFSSSGKFYAELSGYLFVLDKTIVLRRDATIPGEPEYFVNAGKTDQKGIEALVKWSPVQKNTGFVSDVKISGSYAYNNYVFSDYVQGTDDYSGNKLTGAAPVTAFFGADIFLDKKYYFKVSGNYLDHVPLNDANSAFAKEYFLLGARVGLYQQIGGNLLELYAGVDNALDRTYSLGNDLNAVGGRYFNAAAPRNFYFGARFDLAFKK